VLGFLVTLAAIAVFPSSSTNTWAPRGVRRRHPHHRALLGVIGLLPAISRPPGFAARPVVALKLA